MKKFYTWGKCIVRRFLDTNCSMHAAGLTYFALLAVVPILCCILVTAKACGVDQYAKRQINEKIDQIIVNIEDGQNDSFLSHLPGFSSAEQEQRRRTATEFANEARTISNQLFAQIDHFDIGTFGWIGFGFLLWTAISSLASVETSFNEIFDIRFQRPIWKRAYMYTFIMIVLPVLAAIAMSMPLLNAVKDLVIMLLGAMWLTRWVGDGIVWLLDWWLFRLVVTFVTSSVFFAFFFWLIPNCKVRFLSAVKGGMVTALLFGGWMKLCTCAQVGIAKSSALYGSFAFLPIVLAWLYMSWQIVLLGAIMVWSFDKGEKGKL